MAAKNQPDQSGAIAVVDGMEDVLADADMFVRLVDYLAADAFSEHEGGFYRVPNGLADLILFASGKATDAIKACDARIVSLDPRGKAREVPE